MTTNSLSVSNFVSDRKSDVIQQNSSTPLSLTKRKLRLERLLYRSRSFRRRKRCKTFRNVSTQKISSKLLKIAVNSSGVNFKQPTYNWHCKRFTMTKECGYFVPCFSNSLSVQSFEKRLNKSCIVHDQSYMRCVIVTVDENTFSYLSRIMDSTNSVLSGFEHRPGSKRPIGESNIVLHRVGMFPNGCIGPALISFVSSSKHPSGGPGLQRQLCLWMHPSMLTTVTGELTTLRTAVKKDTDNGTFEIKEHHMLNRFELRGSETANILLRVLRGFEGSFEDMERLEHIRNLLSSKHLDRVWRNGDALSGYMADPRLSRGNQHSSLEGAAGSLRWPRGADWSPLWSEAQLAVLTSGFQSDHIIHLTEANKRKEFWTSHFSDAAPSSALPIAGSLRAFAPQSLPFLLLRKHSAQEVEPQEGRNSSATDLVGWDLVVPRKWGVVVWGALQFAGAVLVAGVRETQHLRKSADLVSFPRDFPDTPAGQAFWTHNQKAVERRNLLMPPRKRKCDLPDLSRVLRHLAAAYGSAGLTSSALDEEGFPEVLVVRGRWISGFCPPPFSPELVQALSQAAQEEEEALISAHIPLFRLPTLTLLYVSVTVTGRGLPLDLAEVLYPLNCDRAEWVRHAEARRDKRRGVSVDGNLSVFHKWRGHQLASAVYSSDARNDTVTAKSNGVLQDREGRRVMGVITSGQQPHMNNVSVVIGLCDAQLLNRMFRESFGRHHHPQAHRLVLVRNTSSQWLRPALITIHS